MEFSSKMMVNAWCIQRKVDLIPDDKLTASSEEEPPGPKTTVTTSFALPHHTTDVWKHEILCDFFRREQLHRRVIRILFALTESMADIWEQCDFQYIFHFIQKPMVEKVLQPYVVEKPSIAVFGATNCGKTTLLNVLLGKWWLPEQQTPNTEVVWKISNGKVPQRIRKAVDSNEVLAGSKEWNIEQWLSGEMAEEKLLREREGSKEVYYDLKLPNDLLSCGVELWDTPSLNYDKWSLFERLILTRKSMIPIFLVDAQECLGEDRDVRFIKTMRSKHPDISFLITLGRIDVSLMQLRMDHSAELSSLDSSDEERVMKEISKCEKMRFDMQVPTAKYHQLITSSQEMCSISADKVWDELSNDDPRILRYTERFNVFLETLLETHGKRIQRPFFRVYSRLTQTILCAKSCLEILLDEKFNKERCVNESNQRMKKILNLRNEWTRSYIRTRAKYRRFLQDFLGKKTEDILSRLKDRGTESRFDDEIEAYVTNVLISQAISEANKTFEADLCKKAKESMRNFFEVFEGSEAWIDGIVFEKALKLSNDYLWDRSLIHKTPLRVYIHQLTTPFRTNSNLRRVERVISTVDYERVVSTVLTSYDTLDNDIQELSEISKHNFRNLSLTCQLKDLFPLPKDSEYFVSLKTSVDLLDLLSSTLTEVTRKGMMQIDHSDDHFFGPFRLDDSKLIYAVSLQQNRIQHIKKTLQFVIGKSEINNKTFLKPIDFGYDFRKHFITVYPNFGLSLYEALKEESRRTWDLHQALLITFELLEASEDFLQTKFIPSSLTPDLGPQFILLAQSPDGWKVRIVLMGEVGSFPCYLNKEEIVYLPQDYRKMEVDDLLAHQVAICFWFLIVKSLEVVPPFGNKVYQTESSWNYLLTTTAKDKTLVSKSVCHFFASAFSSESLRMKVLKNLLKVTSADENLAFGSISDIGDSSTETKRDSSHSTDMSQFENERRSSSSELTSM